VKADFRPPPGSEAAMLLQAIDNMSDGLIVLDAQDRFVLCNERYREFYPEVLDMFVPGTPLDEIIDVYSLRTRGQTDAAETFARQRNQAWRAGTSIEEVTPADLWIETRDYKTESGYWVGIRIDVTQRREAEQKLHDLNESLERRVAERSQELADAHAKLLREERLVVLGELTGTVAHELRNPLGTIASTIAIFKAKVKGKNLGVEPALERVDRSIDRCDTIIEELLTYARTSTGQPQPTELDHWVSDTLRSIRVPDHVTVSENLAAPSVEVNIDRERMRRAIFNLINNAVDAVAENQPDSGAEVRVSSRIAGNRAYLHVTDNGPGIPEAIMHKVLDPLFSTKSFGFGLGLPFVVRVLEEHDGSVAVCNRDTGGAQVDLWLPVA
jgi:signal transduction histidine kinase